MYNDTSLIPYVNNILPALQRMEKEAIEYIASCGDYGSTCDELAASKGDAQNEWSGRFTSLKAKKLIIQKRIDEKNIQRLTRKGNNADVYILNKNIIPEIELPLRSVPQGKQAQYAFA